MKIANVNCNGIAIVTTDGEVLATITDEEITKQDNINVFIDAYGFNTKDKWLVQENDLLYYADQPSQLYIVLACDNRFFHMSPVEDKAGNLRVNKAVSRSYPNVKIFGKLQDYGLIKMEKTHG